MNIVYNLQIGKKSNQLMIRFIKISSTLVVVLELVWMPEIGTKNYNRQIRQ